MNGTKLYGMPIETKKYSKQLKDPVFDDQLNYFKQLVNVERNNQSNECNNSRWNDRDSDRKNNIPDSLPEPPTHNMYNSYSNRNDYDRGPNSMSSRSSRQQHGNSYSGSHNPGYRNLFDPIDRSGHKRYVFFDSAETSNDAQDSFHNHNYERKNKDYNAHTSSNWRESSYRNRESSMANKNNSANNMSPGRDLRDIMYGKRRSSDSDYPDRRNASQLDLRDTMYNSKSNKYRGQHYESDSNGRWSEKSNQAYGNFSDKQSRKDNYGSERFNEPNTRYHNNADEGNYDHSLNKKKSYNNSANEYNNEYSNSYNDNYSRGKNGPNNYNNYNQMRSQNMESNSRQQNAGPSYKRKDDGYDRKKYIDSYNDWRGHDRSKNYDRGSGQQSRHYS